ncbi:MAG: SEL1-like repeat protein [Chryseobacterium sp.]|jgi:TPR repeat protein|uniref:SEL1-like repeat protein n=1 Tax=Chryseobacterium sp. TaxID=1871047 RepID=UPI002838088D|nr:SEL1-like repeat protein [Chryseobacterium sp.]MDR2236920.1 SEL1-like repeat protein [Chryseobacterium sp.]
MAHRIYVFNADIKNNEEYPHYLGEWNYEIPALLLPLFFGNPKSKGKMMYFDREQGISYLKTFYQLLADRYQLHYKKVYYEPVNTMFEFLESLPYDTFVVNAWDVFNMSEEKHSDQAKDWIEDIKEKYLMYNRAVHKMDLTVFERELLSRSGYTSFLEMLETDWINYGLGYWNEDAYKDHYETFEENGRWGLQDRKGNVHIPAVYEEIYDFNEEGIAVVKKDGQFGYLKNDGHLAVECRYQDALESVFINGKSYGIIQDHERWGIIDLQTGELSVPLLYDSLELLNYRGLFNAQKDGSFRLIDVFNEPIVSDYSEYPFEYDYNQLVFRKQNGTSKRVYYNLEGICLGEYPEDTVYPVGNGYFWVNPNKFQKKISIIRRDGSLLDIEIDKILAFDDFTVLAYRKGKKWRIYDTGSSQFRLGEFEIENVQIDSVIQEMRNTFIVSVSEGTGLYNALEDRWLVPFSRKHKKIESCVQELCRITVQDGMFYYDHQTDTQSPLYDYICEAIDYNKHLLCLFRGTEMLVFDINRELHKVSDSEMGALYQKKYNLRGKDQKYFLDFYQRWIEKTGPGHEKYFDNQTLIAKAGEYEKEGNIKEAIRLYEIGVDRGDASMMVDLAFILTNDEHPESYDLEKGLSLYQKAARQNEPYAWNNLGYHYQNGIGYPQHMGKALECYTKAAELGNGTALGNLGDIYFYGKYAEQNYDLALDYYKKAEKKYCFKRENISEIYYQKRDYANLQRYLRQDHDGTYSHIYYGILYDHGFGVKQSSKKAIRYYEDAMGYMNYFYALERLLHYYKDDPDFADPEKYKQWKQYGEENDMGL